VTTGEYFGKQFPKNFNVNLLADYHVGQRESTPCAVKSRVAVGFLFLFFIESIVPIQN
jgi:hypothetical protein